MKVGKIIRYLFNVLLKVKHLVKCNVPFKLHITIVDILNFIYSADLTAQRANT